MNTSNAELVNISTEEWSPRRRSYFGPLQVLSREPDQAYAVTPTRGCSAVMDLGDKRTMGNAGHCARNCQRHGTRTQLLFRRRQFPRRLRRRRRTAHRLGAR